MIRIRELRIEQGQTPATRAMLARIGPACYQATNGVGSPRSHMVIYNYGHTNLEKRSLFFAGLARLLKNDRGDNKIDLSDVQMTHYNSRISFDRKISLIDGEAVDLSPMSSIGTAKAWQKKYVRSPMSSKA